MLELRSVFACWHDSAVLQGSFRNSLHGAVLKHVSAFMLPDSSKCSSQIQRAIQCQVKTNLHPWPQHEDNVANEGSSSQDQNDEAKRMKIVERNATCCKSHLRRSEKSKNCLCDIAIIVSNIFLNKLSGYVSCDR